MMPLPAKQLRLHTRSRSLQSLRSLATSRPHAAPFALAFLVPLFLFGVVFLDPKPTFEGASAHAVSRRPRRRVRGRHVAMPPLRIADRFKSFLVLHQSSRNAAADVNAI